ncbi:hypothetical protein [Chitinophaga sp. 22620]|uniref:hypothetical protein n=1 Tax=Chitinophaga sp. 22620 TaxID=3453952 RepID=UPI003F87CE71
MRLFPLSLLISFMLVAGCRKKAMPEGLIAPGKATTDKNGYFYINFRSDGKSEYYTCLF